MNNFKGTPGPWIIEQTETMLWVGTGRKKDLKVDDIIIGVEHGPSYKDSYNAIASANAALIAAAPDLLDCVNDALSDLPMPDGMRNHFESIIAKATTVWPAL